MSSVFHVSNRKSINWAFGLFVVLLFLVLRVPATGSLFNMDEKIAPAVIAGMIQRGDLNGNWMVAEGIPVEFQVNQFNFYSYHLFSWIFYSEESKQFIKNLRLVNVALQAGTLILLIAYLSRFKVTLPRQIMALALFVTSPAMVFDTHIARAECFLYFLFALLLWTTLWSRRPILRYAVFGALLGVGCASKITFILCGAILLPEIVTTLRADWTKALKQLGILILACVLGFAATAPYVFVDFNAFLAGVHALFNQYGTGHPPHSFIEASVGRSVWHTLTFVVLTTGALLPLALFQLLRRPLHAPGLALFGLLLIAYFATKPVFFERNIGIGQLALLTFVVLNFRTKAETLALAASCVLMMYWSFHTAYIFANLDKNERQFELANLGVEVPRVWPLDGLDAYLETCTGMVAVHDFYDDHSRKIISEAQAVPIARFESVFAMLPTSTMHTYLESGLQYYRCAGDPEN